MVMTMRWYGPEKDTVTLEQIRQVPGVTGVITALAEEEYGTVWEPQRIRTLQKQVEDAGLKISGIESVNIHDAIKAGLPERDRYIENYCKTLQNLGEAGINLVCYNFMPVFDWTRSALAKLRPDGSTVLSYDQSIIDMIDPSEMFSSMDQDAGGRAMPGWEPERLARLSELFEIYKNVTDEDLFQNHAYFIKGILPVCERYGIRMAIHPDDPAWPIFGLPRIATNPENLLRLLGMAPHPLNGVTFCTGSLGSNPKNDIPAAIRALKGHIHFAHLRNLVYLGEGKFDEAAHLSSDGSLDMYEIVKALYETGFDGPIRPDHGRMIWGEQAIPGYGLYDRALGAAYLNGLWEAVDKQHCKG